VGLIYDSKYVIGEILK